MNLYITIPQNQLFSIGISNILSSNGFNLKTSRLIQGEGVFLIDDYQLVKRTYHPNQHLILAVNSLSAKTIYTITKAELNGCIENSDNLEHLLKTVEQNMQGKSYFSPKVLKMLFQKDLLELGDRMYSLTDREIEVISLITQGYSNLQIASSLEIGIRTVNAHKRKILVKTQLSSMEELIANAINYGIIS